MKRKNRYSRFERECEQLRKKYQRFWRRRGISFSIMKGYIPMFPVQEGRIWMEMIGEHETWGVDFLHWNIGAFGDSRNEAILNLLDFTRNYMRMNQVEGKSKTFGFKNMKERGILYSQEGRTRGPSPISDIRVPEEPIFLHINQSLETDFPSRNLTLFQKILKKFGFFE